MFFCPGIVFQIKRVQLEDGNEVYCMWVSRDPEEPAEYGRSYANLTLASSLNSTMDQSNYSLGEVLIYHGFFIVKYLTFDIFPIHCKPNFRNVCS